MAREGCSWQLSAMVDLPDDFPFTRVKQASQFQPDDDSGDVSTPSLHHPRSSPGKAGP